MDARSVPAVARIVAALDATSELTSESLAAALSHPIQLADVYEWVRFIPENYRRNLVLRTPRYELRVLCWLPKQRTSLHGHDGSACAFRVVSGTATELRLRQPDRKWPSGTIVREEDPRLVHQVSNTGDEPLVCMNAYAPALPVDQPPTNYEGHRIVIIGGGVAGAALAIHLLASGRTDLRISIVERRQWLGRGPAYGTTDPGMRLNVPANRMSLFSDRGSHFLDWVHRQGAASEPGALLPRQLFGEYVEDSLANAVSAGCGKMWLYRSEAIAASERGVQLGDGTFLPASAVVLATGNQLPAMPAAFPPELLRSNRVIRDPWNANALAAIEPDEDVLVIGTGLTAVDVLLALRGQDHRGRVMAISRRGLLPRPHLSAHDSRRRALTLDAAKLPRGVRHLSRWLRIEAKRMERDGIGWQCLIDALRPITTELWTSLSPADRAIFMRRLRPYWEVVRHRAAEESLGVIEAWCKRGSLEIRRGQVSRIQDDGDRFEVTCSSVVETGRRHFDRIVLCMGPETDVRRWTAPLFRQLLRDGLVQGDALGIGLQTNAEGQALGACGTAVPWLYTLGGLRRPHLWETTSVPDIVRQAEALSPTLLDIVGR